MSKQIPVNSEPVIQSDAYDHIMYQTVRDASSVVSDLSGEKNVMDPLLTDVFTSFYKTEPKIDERAADGHHKQAIDSMMQLTEYKNLRPMTRLDDVASALALTQFAPDLVKAMKQREKDEKDGKDKNEQDGNFRAGIRKSLNQAGEKVEEWSDFCHSFGDSAGELKRLPHEEKMKLANNLSSSKKMKDIAKLLGRLKNIALAAQAANPVHGADEIVDVGQGADLARMLPTEFLKFKRMKTLFFKDFTERSLSTYNLRGVEHVGMGPIVGCCDCSGSMSGDREVWAKAVLLALAFLAERQGRDFAVLFFDTRVHGLKIFPKGKMSIQDKIDLVATGMDGGGTNFYVPLKAAFKIIREFNALKAADIAFITDGECSLDGAELGDVLHSKEKTQARIYGMGVGMHDYEALSGFCDNVAIVDDLGNIEFAKDILFKSAMGAKSA